MNSCKIPKVVNLINMILVHLGASLKNLTYNAEFTHKVSNAVYILVQKVFDRGRPRLVELQVLGSSHYVT